VPLAHGHLAPPPMPTVKETLYYLSDGIYGSFNNISTYLTIAHSPLNTLPVFDHAVPEPNVMRSPGLNKDASKDTADATGKACLFGPTCDSIDVICKDIELPDLSIGDWLYFRDVRSEPLPSDCWSILQAYLWPTLADLVAQMGAYTVASSTAFNGFHPPNAVYWMSGLAPAEKKP
jgi:ornithine decarboxylase